MFQEFHLDSQVIASTGELDSTITFPRVETVKSLNVRAYRVLDDQGRALPLKGVSHGPEKGGHYLCFTLDSAAATEDAREVRCSFEFTINGERMTLESGFRRSKKGWVAEPESLRLKADQPKRGT